MAKIENHKYTIEEAFRDCFYIVPDYQREYVWTEKEVFQLLEDISDEIDSASVKEYFIGTVLVSPTSQNNHFEVIDGQQRLTSFFLILCALKYLFKGEPQYSTIENLIKTSYTSTDGETRTNLKLDPKYENSGELMAKLVEVNSTPDESRKAIEEAGIKSFGSLENILNAYSTIFRFLNDNYADKSMLRKYWGYLANNVIFIQISADISSALKIFETINERGLGLNPMDLLKNLLFTHVKKEEFTKLKDEWKKITKPLEQEKEKPLRFLRYYLMANFKIENKRSDSTVREDEIYDWFINKTNAAICAYEQKPFEFVRKIISNVNNYINFAAGKGNDGKDNIPMSNIKRLCGGGFSLHFVLLLSASRLPKNIYDHFVTQLESFLFYYIFTKTSTKELERNFSIWADELREICDISDQKIQTDRLNAFLIEKMQKNMLNKEPELTDALKRYTLNSMQQYRTRYILAKIAQYIDMAYKGLALPGSLDEYTCLEIEHILPNTPEKELLDSFKINNPEKKYEEYKIKLGNLTLLEKPINIVAGNDFYVDKMKEYKKSKCYLTSSLAELVSVGNNTSISRINQKLCAFSSWGSDSIDLRQDLLIKLAKDIWKIELIK